MEIEECLFGRARGLFNKKASTTATKELTSRESPLSLGNYTEFQSVKN
jgi:hypothetical protein